MSPVTHFFTGWVLANSASLSRRERAIVTLAGVAPDVDGLGIFVEYLTRNSHHPLEWFSKYHHSLHSLPFAVVVAIGAFALATQRFKTAGSPSSASISIYSKILSEVEARMAINGQSPI
jgi:inner membrane protein